MKEENVRRFKVPKNVWQKFDPKWIDECKSTGKRLILGEQRSTNTNPTSRVPTRIRSDSIGV